MKRNATSLLLVSAAKRLGAMHFVNEHGQYGLISDIRDMPAGARIVTEEDFAA